MHLCPHRTFKMIFLVNNQDFASAYVDKTMDLEIQIRLLKVAGFQKFSTQLKYELSGTVKQLQIVDENGKFICHMSR